MPDGSRRPVPLGSGPDNAAGSADSASLSRDGRTVYARSDHDHDLAVLVAVDLAVGAGEKPGMDGAVASPPRVLAVRDDGELQEAVVAADDAAAALLWNVGGGRSALTVLDLGSGGEVQVPLPRAVVDECILLPGREVLLLTAEDWADPRGVWSVDLATGAATALSSAGGPGAACLPRRVDAHWWRRRI